MSKHNYRDTFTIGAILERDGITPKDQHKVGKIGCVENLNTDTPMFFRYSDGYGTLITSNVIEFQEDDYGVWVTTENSMYQLNDYRE